MQDLFKVCTYWLLIKFDIFQARTGALVNLRDAFAPSANEVRCARARLRGWDGVWARGGRGVHAASGAAGAAAAAPAHPRLTRPPSRPPTAPQIADEMTGKVETKVLDHKVAAVEEQVNKVRSAPRASAGCRRPASEALGALRPLRLLPTLGLRPPSPHASRPPSYLPRPPPAPASAQIAKTELHGALPPQLARISKTTALARTSMTGANLARTSATQITQQVAEIEDALAQPLGPNISAEQRAELERRAQEMREAAARLQRVSAVRGDAPGGSSGPTLDTITSGKHL